VLADTIDTFNKNMISRSERELGEIQNTIDEYFRKNNNNTINFCNLINEYSRFANDLERKLVARKLFYERKSADNIFLHYNEGARAFLPKFAQCVNDVKNLNGNLVNLTWKDSTDSTSIEKNYRVTEVGFTSIEFNVKLCDKIFKEITVKPKYILTFVGVDKECFRNSPSY
jgi:hypothetical protein